MKRPRYFQITHEPGRYSRWVVIAHSGKDRSHRTACCDCGLVHDEQMRAALIVKRKGKVVRYQWLDRKAVVVMRRVKRNPRATAGKRRGQKFRKAKR